MAFHSVIMAGGSGTRFWPLSRRDRPKQLLAITGERTMIHQTSDRVAAVTPPARQWVVCGTRHEAGVRAELPELPPAQILVEPIGRNTAPCIGLAALHLCAVDGDAVACVLPSDAFVPDAAAFARHLQAAEAGALAGHITTLGLRPTRPETGYGYIRMAAQQAAHGGLALHAVDRFVEKPDRATADKYLADGSYLWNAGIFVFRAAQMLDAIQRHLPALHDGLMKLKAVLGTPRYADVLREVYPGLPAISIDYGVMEKEPGLYVVPSTFPWSDVGSFAALSEVLPVDAAGNLLRGDVLARDARDCVVDARAGRLCAVVGVQGLIVVDTADALLVIPKDRAQDVGKLLDVLKERGKDHLL